MDVSKSRSFDELYALLKLDRKQSPWSKEQTLQSRYKELVGEIKELGEALAGSDSRHTREELADVFWDAFALLVLFEESSPGYSSKMLEEVIEKYHRRKPWIRAGKSVTADEEVRIWKEMKAKEKQS